MVKAVMSLIGYLAANIPKRKVNMKFKKKHRKGIETLS